MSSEYRLELSGMTCGACEGIIEKIVGRNGATVNEIDANSGFVRITGEEDVLTRIKKELADRGFREKGSDDGSRGDPQRVFAYINSILRVDKSVEAEAILTNYALTSLIISGLAIAIGFMLFLKGMPNSMAYAPLLVLSVFAAVITTFSYNHAKCYSDGISCTNGMMIGMIMGMIPGFMVGAIVGATNGIFVGSVAGMLAGIIMGVKVGKCCGIMGALEGVMAGLMAGLMGAMLSIMALNDHLIAFLYIIFGISGAILIGMSYLLNREIGGREAGQVKTSIVKFTATSLLLTVIMVVLIFFGPKGPIVYP